ncbi:DUF3105 domain-containing protein [Nocardioides sediminis]|uniref:DUF3105 domain-containing protein n=1 Tax=Nocardioides sediminis TaxID=433648 RepID=UPI000D2FF5D9|nr:DUF3105 domain-containing protein [Nocardioides sediminis]
MTEIDDRPPRRSPLLLVLSSVVSLVVIGGALTAPLVARVAGYEGEPVDLSEVQVWEIEDTRHTDRDVDYPQDPPAGGPHAPVWLDCGVYDEPVREENAVHDLEHGTVWITHDPALPERDVEALAEVLPDNGIMSPREGLSSTVVVTVWGAQLALDGARDPRLRLFLDEYGDGHTAPEFGVTCHGGTRDPAGAAPEPGLGA